MARTVASWYALLLGAALTAAPLALSRYAEACPDTRLRSVAMVAAGLLLVAGGIARLMRLPGRIAAAYMGFGAGSIAIIEAMATLLAAQAPMELVALFGLALVALIVASWALWPAN